MKKIISLIAVILFMFSCQEPNDRYIVMGTADGYEDGTPVYIQDLETSYQLRNVDTVYVENGKFKFDNLEPVEVSKLQFLKF